MALEIEREMITTFIQDLIYIAGAEEDKEIAIGSVGFEYGLKFAVTYPELATAIGKKSLRRIRAPKGWEQYIAEDPFDNLKGLLEEERSDNDSAKA